MGFIFITLKYFSILKLNFEITKNCLRIYMLYYWRTQISKLQEELSVANTEVKKVGYDRLPSLVQELANLKFIRVFSTDHDLKLARQDYFTSKQDKVIIHRIHMHMYLHKLQWNIKMQRLPIKDKLLWSKYSYVYVFTYL